MIFNLSPTFKYKPLCYVLYKYYKIRVKCTSIEILNICIHKKLQNITLFKTTIRTTNIRTFTVKRNDQSQH